MRTLWLLRHAKSSWDNAHLPNRVRPLAPRGIRAARRIAAYADSERSRPAIVLCSTARRARETLAALRAALGEDTDVRFVDALYGSTVSR
ncbi:MAG: SixA phosphatase family protein [Acidimicrobiales bacterium]